MKNIYSLLIILFLSSCLNQPQAESIDSESDPVFHNGKYVSKIDLKEFTETGKQYYFIKVWGFLKYYGNFNDTDIDWDEYFKENIQQIKAMDKAAYLKFINKTLALFPKPKDKVEKNNSKDYSLIDNAWFNNTAYFDKNISNTLTYFFENQDADDNEFAEQTRIGNIDFINENSYDDIDYPSENIRLLGLARYWNIISYFYIYKNDMSEDWDTVLIKSIPKFSDASDGRDYHLAVQELSSQLYDCHSMVYSQLMDSKIYGRYVPNFRTKLIDSTLIVKHLRIPLWDDGNIKTGDIILKIDGEDAIDKYRRFNAIMKGANPLSEQRIICPYLFGSVKKVMKLLITRDGKNIEVKLPLKDYSEFNNEEINIKEQQHKKTVLKEYPHSTAYINLDYISDSNFDDNFEAATKYKNLIIDLRNYPHGNTSLNLSSFIIPNKSSFFFSSYADVTAPGLLRKKKGYKLGNDNGDYYKGNVYVLVSEATQSQAEFLAMALQANKKVKIVGSSTAGSDGNVQEFHFPGNIKTVFTGLGIYYPDGTPTQRKGVKLDIEVNQTLSGISQGRDEILEKALDIIKNK